MANQLSPGKLGNFTAFQMGETYCFDFNTSSSGIKGKPHAFHLVLNQEITAIEDEIIALNNETELVATIDTTDTYSDQCLENTGSLCLLIELSDVP